MNARRRDLAMNDLHEITSWPPPHARQQPGRAGHQPRGYDLAEAHGLPVRRLEGGTISWPTTQFPSAHPPPPG